MIEIVTEKISKTQLKKVCQAHYATMVKFVVDIDRKIVALGGEMHADAETLLLEKGSHQTYLWGGNLYPWNKQENRIEFTSFINIRPLDDNMGMEVMDESIKIRIKELIEGLVLAPNETMEPLD